MDLISAELPLEIAVDDRFALIAYDKESGVIYCKLKEEYTPIKFFKSTLLKVSDLVASGINKKFILDKSNLKAFHQPSMRWYFTEWKVDLKAMGLNKHRKILPQEEWFRKIVELERNKILEEWDGDFFEQFDLKYCETVEEAFQS
ncbi:MAG: hypothetical protein LAT68_09580 [Cyclobacteriaceae bacterium]|nr:hypothetical protein [Cyclobacteriaceae bacterium]MCH8516565.1 hypothetical protein [Cyclobacteriaceae bacterium]